MEYPHGTVSRYASKRYNCRCDECRAAVRTYQRERRKRPKVIEKMKHQRAKIYKNRRKYVDSLKDKPCTDCGIKYPPYVMQFDHLDGSTKEGTIAHMFTIASIDAEVKKCELVCANCHAERTHQRRLI